MDLFSEQQRSFPRALLRNSRLRRDCTFHHCSSGHAYDLDGVEGVEAVHECDTEVDFGGLAVWVSCCDALAEGFQAAHPRLYLAAGVVSGSEFPENPP